MRKEWVIIIGLGDGDKTPIWGVDEKHITFSSYQAAINFKRNAEREGKWVKMHRPMERELTADDD